MPLKEAVEKAHTILQCTLDATVRDHCPDADTKGDLLPLDCIDAFPGSAMDEVQARHLWFSPEHLQGLSLNVRPIGIIGLTGRDRDGHFATA